MFSSASHTFPPAPAKKRRRRSAQRFLVIIPAGVLGFMGARLAGDSPAGPFTFLLGMLLGLELHVLLSLLVSRWAGMTVVTMSVGAGKWLGSTTVAGRLLVFRPVPVVPFNTCSVLVRPRKWRLWSAVAGVLAVEAALAVAVAAVWPMVSIGLGIAVMTLLLAKPGTPMSAFWTVFRLPFGDQQRRLEEWTYAPAVLEASRKLLTGRIGEARAALGENDSSPRWLGTACTLALAEGRFAEAAEQANALYERSEAAQPKAGALAVYAAAMADGVAAGHWQPHEALPQFARTMQEIRDTQPLLVRVTDLGAVESLLKQWPKQAAKQAAYAAGIAPDALSRARALCTRAVALAYLGEAAKAREVLAKAERTAPGLDRVAVTRRLLDRTTVTAS
ncbi:hypothetical protein OG607_15870 [Streptomyces sp. NBC_01537]|uniref:hypothetical protein n=1 Tax=Streptomyces sp. NBC_01537 TaxID=2903896 RepID=UPI003863B804